MLRLLSAGCGSDLEISLDLSHAASGPGGLLQSVAELRESSFYGAASPGSNYQGHSAFPRRPSGGRWPRWQACEDRHYLGFFDAAQGRSPCADWPGERCDKRCASGVDGFENSEKLWN